jgi:hypothetical protein
LSFRYALFMLEKANRDWIKVLNYHREPPLVPAALRPFLQAAWPCRSS